MHSTITPSSRSSHRFHFSLQFPWSFVSLPYPSTIPINKNISTQLLLLPLFKTPSTHSSNSPNSSPLFLHQTTISTPWNRQLGPLTLTTLPQIPPSPPHPTNRPKPHPTLPNPLVPHLNPTNPLQNPHQLLLPHHYSSIHRIPELSMSLLMNNWKTFSSQFQTLLRTIPSPTSPCWSRSFLFWSVVGYTLRNGSSSGCRSTSSPFQLWLCSFCYKGCCFTSVTVRMG